MYKRQPLGGSGQIGGNMNLYAYGNEESQKWIIVDTGVSFADDSVPGIDLIYPDPAYIIDKKSNVEFFLTATILVNENMVFNDDVYEFEEAGIPFLAAIGRAVLEEIQKK